MDDSDDPYGDDFEDDDFEEDDDESSQRDKAQPSSSVPANRLSQWVLLKFMDPPSLYLGPAGRLSPFAY